MDAPSSVDVESAPHLVEIRRDGLTVAYRGHGNHAHDFGTVRANRPCPADVPFYYFEVKVVSAGERGAITIGLGDALLPLNQQPGSTDCSFGYCGEDGQAYPFDEASTQYGPPFGTGDVVGCGIVYARQEVFFTKNGRSLGAAYVGVVGELFPVVGMHGPGEVVELCFDPSAFHFSLAAFRTAEAQVVERAIEAAPLHAGAVGAMVEEFLERGGFRGTLAKYRAATTATGGEPQSKDHAHEDDDLRHRVRLAVMAGDADTARAALAREAPQLAERAPRAVFLLACQRVIDLVAAGQGERALTVALDELAPLRALATDEPRAPREAAADWQRWHGYAHKTEQVMGLFAYPAPAESPLAPLLRAEHRALVAAALNEALLGLRAPVRRRVPLSRLEQSLQQLLALKRMTRELAGGRGGEVSLGSLGSAGGAVAP